MLSRLCFPVVLLLHSHQNRLLMPMVVASPLSEAFFLFDVANFCESLQLRLAVNPVTFPSHVNNALCRN